ncbi:hypothetical protein [Acinetobacter rudis]|uniref:Uncharacterized protein n=1 Tax=Acinetobacter rudis TaxID=632955 RepID=A0AAW8JAE4_9GAMM|nr:hypothetical protein [Acinetobacter rudis]MDQ8937047.1 hypothetical protein [Acinetobacter rudis]MDQ9019252.1 hypothetical protein [Acinetobacter rudis]
MLASLVLTHQVYAEPWRVISSDEDQKAGVVIRIDETIEKQPDGAILVRYDTGNNRLSLRIPHQIQVDCSKKTVNYLGSFDIRQVSENTKSNINKSINTVFKEVCRE